MYSYSGKNSPKLRGIVYLAGELEPGVLTACRSVRLLQSGQRAGLQQSGQRAGMQPSGQSVSMQPPGQRARLQPSGQIAGLCARAGEKVLCEVSNAAEIGTELKRRGLKSSECLMLAATDTAIRAAKRLGMAVAGFVNPAFPGQRYCGVEMLIEGFDEVDDEFLLRIFQRHHWIPWTIAETARCVIREFAMEDFDELVRLYEAPGITYRTAEDGRRLPGYIEPLYPEAEERAYQENYIRHMYRYYGYGMWLVIDKESGCLIGRAGLENREYPEGMQVELGYLIHPAWQRRQIATEVCTAIVHYAANSLGCGELNLLTDADNTASAALAEKLGFVYIGDTDISGNTTRRYRLSLKTGFFDTTMIQF